MHTHGRRVTQTLHKHAYIPIYTNDLLCHIAESRQKLLYTYTVARLD